jgi:hypothetical protein
MWLNRFKIALAQKDEDSLEKLLDDIPLFSTKDEANEALYLLKSAIELMHKLQDETSDSMKQVRKNMDFINSTHLNTSKTLDIKS